MQVACRIDWRNFLQRKENHTARHDWPNAQLAVVVKDQLERLMGKRRASEEGQLRRERVGPEWTNYAAGSDGDGGERSRWRSGAARAARPYGGTRRGLGHDCRGGGRGGGRGGTYYRGRGVSIRGMERLELLYCRARSLALFFSWNEIIWTPNYWILFRFRGYIVKTLVKLGFFNGFLLLTVLQYCCHIAGLPKSDSKTASMILCRCFSYIYTNISSEMWTRFEHSLAGESGA